MSLFIFLTWKKLNLAWTEPCWNKLSQCLQPSRYYWRKIVGQAWLVLLYDVRSHRSTQHWLEKLFIWINHSHLHLSRKITHIAFPPLLPIFTWWPCLKLEKTETICGEFFTFRWSNLHSFSLASFLFQWKRYPSIRVNSTTYTLDLTPFFLKNLILSVISCEIAKLKRLVFYFVLHLSNIKKNKLSFMLEQVLGFKNFLFIDFRERKKHWLVVPLIYAVTGCFLYVPWPEIEPTTLMYWNNAVTN